MLYKVIFDEKNIDILLQKILFHLKRILSKPPLEKELKKVVLQEESAKYNSFETAEGMAHIYATYEQIFQDYQKYEEALEFLKTLNPEQIQQLAIKYLKPESLNLCLLYSQSAGLKKEILEKNLMKFKNQYKKEYKKIYQNKNSFISRNKKNVSKEKDFCIEYRKSIFSKKG